MDNLFSDVEESESDDEVVEIVGNENKVPTNEINESESDEYMEELVENENKVPTNEINESESDEDEVVFGNENKIPTKEINESESDEDMVEFVGNENKDSTNKIDVISRKGQEKKRQTIENSEANLKSKYDEGFDSEYEDDDDVSDVDEQIERHTNFLAAEEIAIPLNSEKSKQMNSPIKSISLDSNDESDDDDDESDLEVIEEHFEDDFEDTMESKKNALPPKDKEEKQVVTEIWQKPATESFTTDLDKNSFSKCYNGEVAKENKEKVDSMINSYLDNLLTKREKWEGRGVKASSPSSSGAPSPAPGSPDSGLASPEPTEERGHLGPVSSKKKPFYIDNSEEQPKKVESQQSRKSKGGQRAQGSKAKVVGKPRARKALELPQSEVELAKPGAVVLEEAADGKEKNKEEDEKEDNNKEETLDDYKTMNEALEVCRYCKELALIGFSPCPAIVKQNQNQKIESEIDLDVDFFFETLYNESMGDYMFFADDVDPLPEEDIKVLKGEKDGNPLASLCSECSDDFYWQLEKRFDLREPHSCPLTRHKARVVGGILLGEPPLCQKMDKCLRSECEGGVGDVLPISKKVGDTREERRRAPYSRRDQIKCGKCQYHFFSIESLSNHATKFHPVEMNKGLRESEQPRPGEQKVGKEVTKTNNSGLYNRSEQALKENDARKGNSVVRSADPPKCRFCKLDISLGPQCPEREKKSPIIDYFDADSFLEREFINSMGVQDLTPGSKDVKVFTPEEMAVFEESPSDLKSLCLECHDDFFWPGASHTCLFTSHGKRVVGGELLGNLPCADKTNSVRDCRICSPKASDPEHLNNRKVTQEKVVPSKSLKRSAEQVLPSKSLKRPAENILLNLPKSTKIMLNGRSLNNSTTTTKRKQTSSFDCSLCGVSCKSYYFLNKHKQTPCKQLSTKKVQLNSRVSIQYQPDVRRAGIENEVTEHKILEAFRKVDHLQQESDSYLPCLYCNTKFYNPNNLIAHLSAKHGIDYENAIPCIYCEEEFKDESKLATHVEEEHEREVSPITVEVKQEDFKIMISQEQLEINRELYELDEEAGLEEKRYLAKMKEADDTIDNLKDNMLQGYPNIKIEPVWMSS